MLYIFLCGCVVSCCGQGVAGWSGRPGAQGDRGTPGRKVWHNQNIIKHWQRGFSWSHIHIHFHTYIYAYSINCIFQQYQCISATQTQSFAGYLWLCRKHRSVWNKRSKGRVSLSSNVFGWLTTFFHPHTKFLNGKTEGQNLGKEHDLSEWTLGHSRIWCVSVVV